MPVWRRKELREQLGVKSAKISTYIKRGKLVPSDEKGYYFDTSEQINREFIAKHGGEPGDVKQNEPEQAPEPEPTQREQPEQPPVPEAAPVKKAKSDERKDPLTPPKEQTKPALDAWKKRLEAEQTKERVEVLRLQKEKILGNNLPYEMVERLLSSVVKNYTESFKEYAEAIVEEFSAIAGLSSGEQANMKDKLIHGINTAGKRANDAARKDLKNIVFEVQETRSRGESALNVRNE